MCSPKNGFFGAYPWSKPVPNNPETPSYNEGEGEGVTREEVQRMLTDELAYYVSTNNLSDKLLNYVTSEYLRRELGRYPTRDELTVALRDVATVAAVRSEIQQHAGNIAGAFLGHVRGIQKTAEYTERCAIDDLGQVWFKPSKNDLNPITQTENMRTPVGKAADGTLWCDTSGGGEIGNFVMVFPTNDFTGRSDTKNIRDAMENNIGKIYLAPGAFYINDMLELPARVHIYGNGGIGNSPTKVRNGEEQLYGTAIILPEGNQRSAIRLINEGSGIHDLLIVGGGTGSTKFPTWLTHNELINYSRGSTSFVYDMDGCGIIYGGAPDSQIAGADVQCNVSGVCVIGFAVAGLKILPASWCSFFSDITIRRCSAGLMTCNLASDDTIVNLHVDNCTDNIHMSGTGNFRLCNIKSFADGCLMKDGVRSGVGKSFGLYMDGCGNNMITNFEVQDSAGTPVWLAYCYNNQLTLQTDRGRTVYTQEQLEQYHVTAKNCFSNLFIINCNKHDKAYKCYKGDSSKPCGNNTAIVTGCQPNGEIALSYPYDTDIFIGAK